MFQKHFTTIQKNFVLEYCATVQNLQNHLNTPYLLSASNFIIFKVSTLSILLLPYGNWDYVMNYVRYLYLAVSATEVLVVMKDRWNCECLHLLFTWYLQKNSR